MTGPSARELTRIARLRVLSQGAYRPQRTGPVEVVRHLAALQGQDLPGALYSVALRTSRPALSAVVEALARGDIVRSWTMRGTLHLCTAEDLPLFLGLTAERMLKSFTTRHRQLGITEADVEQARELTLARVAGGGATRAELFEVLEAAGQRTDAQRGIHLLLVLSLQRHLVQGPLRGNQQLFMPYREWIPDRETVPAEGEALASLAVRYFHSHGPATLADLAWWTKLPLTAVRAAVQSVRGELAVKEYGGQEYFGAPAVLDLPESQHPGSDSLCLLPGFDELILGYTDRSAALAQQHAARIVPGGNGVFRPTILRGGRVVGTWRKKPVVLEPFVPLGAGVLAAAERAAGRYERFLTR
ncbi:winged helix DNA-binding domain-containing protein [Psychromicrobium xiongbiense]|uniref:winged helix DNA-binding domain-containing protein n=1 Tax=Psychromicrobium xiongbiense TaxID=3051184 RepID=UPI00255242BC|nr:winged helix DNA-binding domain-containing protein [Psychromicrobium sp. YIM S02556]